MEKINTVEADERTQQIDRNRVTIIPNPRGDYRVEHDERGAIYCTGDYHVCEAWILKNTKSINKAEGK